MFVKIENYWLNTEQIVAMTPSGKSFRIELSNKEFLMLSLTEFIVLIRAIGIDKPSIEARKASARSFNDNYKKKVATSPAVSDKAKPKRVAVKETEAKTLKKEHGKGASGGKPKTKLVKKPLSIRNAKVVPKKK